MAKFNLTAQLQLQQPRNLNAIAEQLRKQLGNVDTSIRVRTNTRAIKEASTAIGLVNTEAISATRSTSELGKTIGLAARRFGAISIATGTFLSLVRGIKKSTSEAIAFDRELNKIKQATGASGQAIKEVSDRVTELSTNLGVNSTELVEASRVLAQAGFNAKTAAGALKILAQTDLAATFDSIEDTTEGAVALLQQFGREAIVAGREVEFLEQSLSAINAVSKAYAVESADIIAAIRKTGGSFEAAGGDLNELLALFTSVRATTRESADTIATAFRTIFTRIQRTETVDALRELGVELQDANGKFVGPMKAIENLSVALSVLDSKDFRFTQIVEELGGIRQIGKVIPLLKQNAVAQQAYAVALKSTGSLAKDAETAQESLAVQIAKVKEEFNALVREFVAGNTFKSMTMGILELARAFIKVADAIQPILPLLAIAAGGKLGQGLVSAFGSFTGIKKKHDGGKIHRFASGGMVPGSGNGDTVPAMLTPGEFVIKKSSVQKIGAEKLQQINAQKFAAGGRVDVLKENLAARKPGGVLDQDRVGALIFEPESKVKATRRETSVNVVSSDFDTKDSNGNIVQLSKNFPNVNKNFTLVRSGVDESLEKNLRENVRLSLVRGLTSAINNTGTYIKSIAPSIRIKDNLIDNEFRGKFERSIGEGTIGAMFEALVASMSDPTFTNASQRERPFDFIGKIAQAEKLFDGSTRGIKYRDARATISAASTDEFKGKIVRQAIEESDAAKTKVQTAAPIIGKKYLGKSVNALLGLPINGSGITHEKRLAKAASLDYVLIGENETPEPGKKQFKARSLGVDKAGASKGYEYEFFAKGGMVRDLALGSKGGKTLDKVYDTKAKYDAYPQIIINEKDLPKPRAHYRDEAEGIWGNAAKKYKKDKNVEAANQYIKSRVGGFVQTLGANELELGDDSEQRLNKIAGGLAEKDLSKLGTKLPDSAGADFKVGPNKYAEVKTNQNPVPEALLKTKALLAYTVGENRSFHDNADNKLGNQPPIELDFYSQEGYARPRKDEKVKAKVVREAKKTKKFALGGPARGSDTVPAMLTPGEYVINKSAAQKIGYGRLNKINKTGNTQYLAKGGPVGGDKLDFSIKAPGEPFKDVFKSFKEFEQYLSGFAKNIGVSVKSIGKLSPEHISKGFRGLARRDEILGAAGVTNKEDAAHEVGHLADSKMGKGGKFASEIEGTLQHAFVGKFRKIVEAELAKLTPQQRATQITSGGKTQSYEEYRLSNKEVFASGFAVQPLEVQKKLASQTDFSGGFEHMAPGYEKQQKDAKRARREAAMAPQMEEEARKKRLKNEFKQREAEKAANRPGQDADTTKKLYNLGGDDFIKPASKIDKQVKINKSAPGDMAIEVTRKLTDLGFSIEETNKGLDLFTNQIKKGVGERTALNNTIKILDQEEKKLAKAEKAATKSRLDSFAIANNMKLRPGYQSSGPLVPPRGPGNISLPPGGGPPDDPKSVKVKSTSKQTETNNQVVNTGSSLAQNFLLMGGAITAVIGQLGLFDQATAEVVAQSVAMGAAVYGIGSTLLDGVVQARAHIASTKAVVAANVTEVAASNASAAADNAEAIASTRAAGSNMGMAKGLAVAQSALVGFSVGMGVLQYVLARIDQEKERTDKSVEKELQRTKEKGDGSLTKITREMLESAGLDAKRKDASNKGTGGAAAGAGVGAVTGAYIGTALGPVGTAVGALIGGIVGGVGGAIGGSAFGNDSAAKTNDAVNMIKYSAEAQYAAAKATYAYTKAIDDARLKNLKGADAVEHFIKANQEADVKGLETRTKFRSAEIIRTRNHSDLSAVGKMMGYGEFTDEEKRLSDAGKADIEEQRKQKIDLTNQLGGAIDDQVSMFMSKSKGSMSLDDTLKGSGADKALKVFRQSLLDSGQAATEKEADEIVSAKVGLYKKEQEALNANLNAQMAAVAAKEAEISLALKTNAALNSLVQTSRDFENSQNSLTRALGFAENSVKDIPINFAAAFADISKVGNRDEFVGLANQAASTLGPEGKVFADQVVAMSDSIGKLRQGLSDKALKDIQDRTGGLQSDAGKAKINELLKDILKDDFDKLGPDLRKKIVATIQERSSKGDINQATIQDIVEEVSKSSQGLVDVLRQAGEAGNNYVAQYTQASEAILAYMNKEATLRAGLINIQQKGQDRLAEVFSGRISESTQDALVNEREVNRTAAAQTLLGPNVSANAGDVSGLSSTLTDLNTKYKDASKSLKDFNLSFEDRAKLVSKQKELADSAEKVRAELSRLSDQSERAADIMGQIGRERSKREFAKSEAKEFILGTQEERMNQSNIYQGANVVARTGSFQSVPEEMRRSVSDLLDQLAELEPGGMADQVRQRAFANDAMMMGIPPQIAQALASNASTSKEEKLINDLRILNEQEKAAQLALIAAEQENTKSMSDLIVSIEGLAATIANNFKNLASEAVKGPQTLSRGGVVYANKGTFVPKGTDTVPAMLTPGEYVINKSAVDKYGKSFLDSVNNGSLKGDKPIYRAKGGLTRERIEALMKDPNNKLSRADLESIGPDRKGEYKSGYLSMQEEQAKKEKQASDRGKSYDKYNRIDNAEKMAKINVDFQRAMSDKPQAVYGFTAKQRKERMQQRHTRNVDNAQMNRLKIAAKTNNTANRNFGDYQTKLQQGPLAQSFLQNRYSTSRSSKLAERVNAQMAAGGQQTQPAQGGVAYNQNVGQVQAPAFAPAPQANNGGNMRGMFDNLISGIPTAINSGLSDLVKSMTTLSENFNGMHMTHEVNLNGQINVAGINTEAIAEAIKQGVAEHVMSVVKKEFDKNKNSLRAG